MEYRPFRTKLNFVGINVNNRIVTTCIIFLRAFLNLGYKNDLRKRKKVAYSKINDALQF